jgi:hypothetical protein
LGRMSSRSICGSLTGTPSLSMKRVTLLRHAGLVPASTLPQWIPSTCRWTPERVRRDEEDDDTAPHLNARHRPYRTGRS